MASLRGRKAAAPIAAGTEATTSLPATETDPNSPGAGQDPQAEHQREQQCQRRLSTSLSRSRSRSPSSNPRRLSAPHSTVATEEGNGYDLSTPPFSPDSSGSNRCGRSSTAASAASTSGGATSHEIRGRVRSRRHCSSSSGAAKDAGVGVDGSNGATRHKSADVKVDADVLSVRGGVDFAVEAIGPLVRWTIKTNAGQQQQHQEQQEGSSGRGEDQTEVDGHNANSAVCDNTDQNKTDKSFYLLFIPDSTDDPPLMRQILTRDNGSYEETFDRPGRSTFVVGSGPMTMGRVVVSGGGGGVMAFDDDIIDNDSTAAGSCEARAQTGKCGRESYTVRTILRFTIAFIV